MAQDPREFDPLDPQTVECPFPFYEAMRASDPVYKVPGYDWFLVSSYEHAVEVLMEQDFRDSTEVERADQSPTRRQRRDGQGERTNGDGEHGRALSPDGSRPWPGASRPSRTPP